ncbi:MAG: DUF935 domain-containing protein, partial [Opitutaceae bacterium]|nr:DUF935 domain-containing protein [Opitutaceae bacterium]
WKYNPEALHTTFDALPEEYIIDEGEWLCRTVARPLGGLALVKFWRENLTDRNWDAAQEIFALPAGIVILPPEVAADAETTRKYLEVAERISKGAPGVLPAGSQFIPVKFPTEIVPLFKDRKADLQARLILAGTGGLLTSLAQPAGLGSGAADTQADVFARLAAADAARISEVLQRRLDREVLERAFPMRRRLAYFRIGGEEPDDSDAYAARVVSLAGAGYITDAGEAAEKLGMTIVRADGAAGVPSGAGADDAVGAPSPITNYEDNRACPRITNGAGAEDGAAGNGTKGTQGTAGTKGDSGQGTALADLQRDTLGKLAEAERQDWAPLEDRLAALADAKDEAAFREAAEKLREELPDILEEVYASGKTAQTLADAMAKAAELGVHADASEAPAAPITNGGEPVANAQNTPAPGQGGSGNLPPRGASGNGTPGSFISPGAGGQSSGGQGAGGQGGGTQSGGSKNQRRAQRLRADYDSVFGTTPASAARRAFSRNERIPLVNGQPSNLRWGGTHITKDHPERMRWFGAAKLAASNPDKIMTSPQDSGVLMHNKLFKKGGKEFVLVVLINKQKRKAFDYIPMKASAARNKGYIP